MLGYYEKPDEIQTLKLPIFIDVFDTERHYEKPWKTMNLETSNQQVEGSIPSGVAILSLNFKYLSISFRRSMSTLLTWLSHGFHGDETHPA
jgi:hypothetical protein